MSARTIHIGLGLVALLCTLPVLAAGQVYQWKDAQGVTHYSDSPPPAQNQKGYKKTRIEQAPPAAAAPAEDPRCTIARTNLERIKGAKGPIGLDENGDGKPDKEMNDDQIAYQVHLAQATVKNTCTPLAKE